MEQVKDEIRCFFVDEMGQDLIEYALVTALVAVGAVVSLKSVSTKIGTVFTSIGTTLTTSV